MQKEIAIEDVEKILNEDNIDDVIIVKRKSKSDVVIMNFEDYKKLYENNLVEKLKKAEKQIQDGEVFDGEYVLQEMREKYEYK